MPSASSGIQQWFLPMALLNGVHSSDSVWFPREYQGHLLIPKGIHGPPGEGALAQGQTQGARVLAPRKKLVEMSSKVKDKSRLCEEFHQPETPSCIGFSFRKSRAREKASLRPPGPALRVTLLVPSPQSGPRAP